MLRLFAHRRGVGSAILVDRSGRASAPGQRLKASSVTLAAVLALTVATPTENLGSLGPVRDAAAAAVTGAADAIRKRSPGLRRIVRWVKGTPIYARPAARAAPRIRRPVARAAIRPPALPALLTPPPPSAPLALAQNDLPFGPVTIGPLPVYDLADTEEFAFIRLPGERGPGFIIGGGGGGGGGPGGLLPPPIIRPPAIPEASTWTMMILGFGAIGTAWRRRRQIVRAIISSGLLRLSPPAGSTGG